MLAAHARDDAHSDRVGAHLPREVHLHGRIDGHDLRVLPDAERVVGPCHVLHHEVFAVVHVVIQPARAEGQRGHRHAGHHRFLRVVDHAAFQQRQHAVGHRLGVQSQMPVAAEGRQYGVRNAAHADLQRRPVGNQFGDVAADFPFRFARHGRRDLHQRRIDLHGRRQARGVDHGVAVGVGHRLVDLRDDGLGALHGGNRQIGRDAERAVAFGVGRRDVDEREVEGQRAVAEQRGDFAQEGRNGLSVAVGQPPADVVGDEQAVDEERLLVFGAAVGGVEGSHGEGRIDRHMLQFAAPFGHCGHERFGDRGAALNVDAVVGPDEFYRLRGSRVVHVVSGYFLQKRLNVLRAFRTVRGGSSARRRRGCRSGGCRSR